MNEINELWEITPKKHAKAIESIKNMGYSAWAVKDSDYYGVAIPFDYQEPVKEEFANVVLLTGDVSFQGEIQKALILACADYELRDIFSSLCAEFVFPGECGIDRTELLNNPVEWWKKWKRLLGNRNVDPMVYDVLGELCAVLFLSQNGKDASWNGPSGNTYDIDCGDELYEVKSSVIKSHKSITIHNQFQLNPPGKKLYIVFCQFVAASNWQKPI